MNVTTVVSVIALAVGRRATARQPLDTFGANVRLQSGLPITRSFTVLPICRVLPIQDSSD